MLAEFTQTYSGTSATIDILFIVGVTFVLGYLARMIYEAMVVRSIHQTLALYQVRGLMNEQEVAKLSQEKPEHIQDKEEVNLVAPAEPVRQDAPLATQGGDNITQTTYTQMSTTSISHNENHETMKDAPTIDREHYVEATPIVMPYKLNDLKMVEGIGPKIEQLLKDGGIDTWKKLSETPAEDIKTLLRSAGERYRIHDPTTWPEQALLAVENKWAELEEYQGALSGGKDLTRIYKKTS